MGLENKVRVTKLFGGGGALGAMNPKVGMVTHLGTIIALASGNFQVRVSGAGVGMPFWTYPDQLYVHINHASGVHAYSSGDGSVVFGRNPLWPSGVSRLAGTGMYYHSGDEEVVAFSR